MRASPGIRRGEAGFLTRQGSRLAGGLLAAALAAAGCGVGADTIPETRYFVIDYTLPPAPVNPGHTLPVSVGVDPFRSDAVYRTEKIVFRKVPYRVDFYPYERWGARPDEFVTDRLIDHLLASSRFREVVRATGGIQADYLVRGRVKRFEEVDSPDGRKYSALAEIEITVADRRTGAVLLQKRISRTTPAKVKAPQKFVDAMAENLKGLLTEATDHIAEAVARHHKGGQP